MHVRIVREKGMDIRTAVFHVVAREGWVLRELGNEERSLEDAFVELTKAREGQF